MAVDSEDLPPFNGGSRDKMSPVGDGTDSLVRYDLAGDVASITLNRPSRLNAVNNGLVTSLCDALDRAASDDVGAVVLGGAGRAFCSGHDLKEDADGRTDHAALGRLQAIQDVTRKIRGLPAPVLAAVHGFALGAGCEFALCCDLVVAQQDAVFGFPEVEVGLGVTGGISHLLPRTVGAVKAKELILLGTRIDAEEALRLGLVNVVVADARTHALSWAAELATRPRLAMALAKEYLDQGMQGDIESAYHLEAVASLALIGTPDSLSAAERFRDRPRELREEAWSDPEASP